MVLAFLLATALGIVIALARISKVPDPERAPRSSTSSAFAGTPVLVILFWVYFGLPEFGSWLAFSSFTAAVIGLGLHGAAFLAEIFRSGIEALHRGQMEAALSVGMTPAKAMRYIILPQATRVVLPPIANYAVGLLKETALCSIIAAPELMLRAKDLASSSFLPDARLRACRRVLLPDELSDDALRGAPGSEDGAGALRVTGREPWFRLVGTAPRRGLYSHRRFSICCALT